MENVPMKMDNGWAVAQLSRAFLVCTRTYVQFAVPQNVRDENGQEKGMLREKGEAKDILFSSSSPGEQHSTESGMSFTGTFQGHQ